VLLRRKFIVYGCARPCLPVVAVVVVVVQEANERILVPSFPVLPHPQTTSRLTMSKSYGRLLLGPTPSDVEFASLEISITILPSFKLDAFTSLDGVRLLPPPRDAY
jgi:hypothetical protein